MSDTTPPLTNPLIENDYFYLSSDETYYIVGSEYNCSGMGISGDIVIPAEYNGKPVKEIRGGAFRCNGALTGVVIDIVHVNSVLFLGVKKSACLTSNVRILYVMPGKAGRAFRSLPHRSVSRPLLPVHPLQTFLMLRIPLSCCRRVLRGSCST